MVGQFISAQDRAARLLAPRITSKFSWLLASSPLASWPLAI